MFDALLSSNRVYDSSANPPSAKQVREAYNTINQDENKFYIKDKLKKLSKSEFNINDDVRSRFQMIAEDLDAPRNLRRSAHVLFTKVNIVEAERFPKKSNPLFLFNENKG